MLADTVADLAADGYKFLIVGSPGDEALRRHLEVPDPELVRVLPRVSFEDVPAYLRAGDLVCLLQDRNYVVANYQMPAKFTDALAMGLPIVGTDVPPLARVARDGVLEVLQDGALGPQIKKVFADGDVLRERSRRNREHFRKLYSYSSVRPALMATVEGMRGRASPMASEFSKLLAYHRSRGGTRGTEGGTTLEVAVCGHTCEPPILEGKWRMRSRRGRSSASAQG